MRGPPFHAAGRRPGDDAKNAADPHKQVSAVLEADGRLKNLGVSCFFIGSYGRDVSIKRVKDVDVLVRLKRLMQSGKRRHRDPASGPSSMA